MMHSRIAAPFEQKAVTYVYDAEIHSTAMK